MTDLSSKNCISCNRDTPPLSKNKIAEYQKQIPGWDVVQVDGIPHLRRTFKFENFAEALSFTNDIGEIAEEQGHHPLIELTWGRVTVEWWTHNINGLHENDFIMAAKTSERFGE